MKIINKFLSKETKNFLVLKLQKKISKRLKIYFIPTVFDNLPTNNYHVQTDINYQKHLIREFEKNKKINSFNTFSNIVELLNQISIKNSPSLNFLDFGGENIDFYLDLNKNFKNLNYYVINQGEINKTFIEIKKNYKFNNLNILENLNEVEKNSYDFINFGSSIQYINNYDDILTRVLKTSKKFIFFSGTHFYKNIDENKNKIVVKQINLLPKKFYCYFFNFEKFLFFFKKNNYSIFFNKFNATADISYKNFKNIKNIQYLDLLLSK